MTARSFTRTPLGVIFFHNRGVEQPGSSSGSEPEGRRFKSYPRNQFKAP